MNIHQATDLDVSPQFRAVVRDIKAKEAAPPKVEDLLLDGVDQVAEGWVIQLQELRTSIDALEQQIITCVGDIKDRLKRLTDLGTKVKAEMDRFDKVADEVEQIAG